MRLHIKTTVKSPLERVINGFDESLFKKLSPPFPKVHLKRFDGSKTGDIVSLELDFILFRQTWSSKIVSDSLRDNQWSFVDRGIELPFFLKEWRHQHDVKATKAGSIIGDKIEYYTGSQLTDVLFYPLLWLQFAYRKPIYKRVFG
ncbi:MAG: hypothetical protein KI790_19575 [Cyclobacteriaceae bacterium]|nr:hypothetical protein [Cyclobacteriaceae bacterium HetDA_MAG_MS6]